MRSFFISCALVLTACLLLLSESATAQGSYGSHGFRSGRMARIVTAPARWTAAALHNGVERRQSRRHERQAEHGYGSAGSHGYETTQAVPEPAAVVERPVVIESNCPNGMCPAPSRRFILGGNRRNALFN